METVTKPVRQAMGCAYESIPAELRRPVGVPLGCEVVATVCSGYTTKLPEVIEVARARLHWSKGGPAGIGIADWADSPLCAAIEVLEGSSNEVQAWALENPVKKAGA